MYWAGFLRHCELAPRSCFLAPRFQLRDSPQGAQQADLCKRLDDKAARAGHHDLLDFYRVALLQYSDDRSVRVLLGDIIDNIQRWLAAELVVHQDDIRGGRADIPG